MSKDKMTSATIEIPGVNFEDLARQVIAVKVTEALSVGSSEAVQRLVMAALTRQVNPENGNEPRSYDPKCSWVEFVAGDLIRQATKQVLTERVEAMKPAIKTMVEAELKRNTKSIASALVDAYAAEAKSGYRLTVALAFKPKD
jgi:hypothetical protein